MEYHFTPKEFRNEYSKTWVLDQRLIFDHKNKTVFIRGIWINKGNGKVIRYKVVSVNEQEEFGSIPEIPEFKDKITRF